MNDVLKKDLHLWHTRKPWILIFGPTASGKSQLATRLAEVLEGFLGSVEGFSASSNSKNERARCAILSCDSVAVYRGFDVGAAKPSPHERGKWPHYLLDIVDADASFDAADFALRARTLMECLWSQGCLPIVVGGTGLYLRALKGDGFDVAVGKNEALREQLREKSLADLWQMLSMLDSERAHRIHPHDRVRLIRGIEIATAGFVETQTPHESLHRPVLTVAIEPERHVLHERIMLRTERMLADGLVEEVQGLLASGVTFAAKPMQSIGYRQVAEVLLGKMPREGLNDRILAATRQYAKRQCTWFKKVERDISIEHPDQLTDFNILEFFKKNY